MKNAILRTLLACAMAFACGAPFAETGSNAIAAAQRRGVEQTFLTFPEWFLVHSPAEYAQVVTTRPAHAFPFIGHVSQLWSSYRSVAQEQLRGHYPANIGYHVMICVIAGSTTVEYALRSLYENTLGRLSWAAARELTAEDRYGATVAQDYVDFIRRQPWYLYDYPAKLKGLWTTVPAFGPGMLRKWERRYALTTEYVVKGAYAKLIGVATSAAYDPALLTTQVIADRVPADLSRHPGVKLVRPLADGTAVLDLPRYYDFRLAATRLAGQGVQLVDIAGNRSVILVSAIAGDGITVAPAGGRILFEQPIITQPGRKRTAFVVPVASLSRFLANAQQKGIEVEHVYDY